MNDNLKPITTIPPFKRLCMTIGELPSSYLESMTYYEMLLWFTKYLQETVIPAINNNGEAVTELQTKYLELKNYVDTYFDNLDVQEEINNKLDEMAESGELQEIMEQYYAVRLPYYKIDTSMSESDIIEIMEKEEPKVIEFTNGTYTFTNTVHITSNTKYLLNNATLTTSNNKMFLFYKSTDTFTGYDGVHNVSFEGGNLGISSALMHNRNIKYNNVNFLGTLVTHAIQIGGSKGIEITNCTFNGIVLNDENGQNIELIQLETCTSAGQPYIPETSPMFNNLGNIDVKITGCVFNEGDNTNNKFYVGIGHHSGNTNNRYSQENIEISYNKFYNPYYSAISIFGLNNATISYNEFHLTNASDFASTNPITVRLRGNNKNFNIENNLFNGFVTGIDFVNVNQCENALIDNNKFKVYSTYAATSIGIKAITNCKISNNYIEIGDVGVYVIPQTNLVTENVEISNNQFINTKTNHSYTIRCNANSYRIKVKDNYCLQLGTNDFMYYLPGDSETTKPLYFANNFIENPNDRAHLITKNASINYKNTYNYTCSCWSASNNTYQAITNQAPTVNFNNFNRLRLRLIVAGNAEYMYREVITPYQMYNKFVHSSDVQRNYSFAIPDNSGNIHVVKFTINTDGTFNYNGDSAITLNEVRGYNELELV